MFKRFMAAAFALTISAAAFAQQGTPTQTDLERRVRELEERIEQMRKNGSTPQLDELRRQIDILTQEVEKLKGGEKNAAQADATQYGLGAAASKVYHSDPGVSIGGYGEFLYQNFSGAKTDTAGMLRGVLYTGYKFSNRALFNSELEVEGASTEGGGSVSMEFAYLDYLIRPALNVRAGIVLIPVGIINEQHEPTAYFGARRPVVERVIIPATWGEIGVGVFGDVGPVSYRGYVVTGLNSEHFSGDEGIRQGRQAGADAKAESWAVVGRADWHPFEGTLFGGSLYSGNSGQGAGFGGRVTLGEVHADSKFRGAALRALYARGSVGDAAAINESNGLTGGESVGKTFGGWYVEAGYDIAAKLGVGYSLSPYARYERFDTQSSVPLGFMRNPENNGRVLTIGAAFKPVPQTVIKVDWQRVSSGARSGVNQFNVGVGYIF